MVGRFPIVARGVSRQCVLEAHPVGVPRTRRQIVREQGQAAHHVRGGCVSLATVSRIARTQVTNAPLVPDQKPQ